MKPHKPFDLLDLLASTPNSRFLKFHEQNPHVLKALEEAARRHINRHGITRTSVDYLVHIARFEAIAFTNTNDEFKIGNSYTPYYARLIIDRHAAWAGLFEMRKSVADDDASWICEAA